MLTHSLTGWQCSRERQAVAFFCLFGGKETSPQAFQHSRGFLPLPNPRFINVLGGNVTLVLPSTRTHARQSCRPVVLLQYRFGFSFVADIPEKTVTIYCLYSLPYNTIYKSQCWLEMLQVLLQRFQGQRSHDFSNFNQIQNACCSSLEKGEISVWR